MVANISNISQFSDVDRKKNWVGLKNGFWVAQNYACFNFTKQYVYTTFFSLREF